MGRISNGGSGGPARPPQILVIDDLASARGHIADRLTEAGFLVSQTATLAKAREDLATSSPFAAIVVDVALKDGGGEDFARETRNASPKCCVVVMTGYSEFAMRERLSDDPSIAVLGKPFESDALILALRELGVRPDH